MEELSLFRAWQAEQQAKREATERAEAERLAAEETAKNAPASDVPMIVHHETYFEGTVQHTRTHGPMPVSEWAEYERKYNL